MRGDGSRFDIYRDSNLPFNLGAPRTKLFGPIGGIQLKMIAARDKGATVFLAPAGNCSDVRGATPDGLQVVKVSTLHGAVQDLLRIQHGQPVPSC